MMANERFAIGIDLGGTKIKGVLIEEKGHVLHKLQDLTRDEKNEYSETGKLWKKLIYDMVQNLKEKNQQNIETIGLAAPGIPNDTNDSIAHMPERLEGLEELKWSSFLSKENIPVTVINDAQAAVVAESTFGVGRDKENIVMLTLGTGVGGGVIINGQLYQGNFQRAGHWGHMTVNASGPLGITGTPGSLEDAVGNATLPKRSLGEYKSTKALVDAYKAGDHFATYIWLDSVRNLSVGIVSLINTFSPDLIILGGGIAQADELLFEPLEQFLNCYEWQPGGAKTPIKKAKFHNFSGAIGAALFSLQQQ